MSTLREQLAELKALLADGLITDEDYNSEKAALLASRRSGAAGGGPLTDGPAPSSAADSLLDASTRMAGAGSQAGAADSQAKWGAGHLLSA